jgi:hypothetical protein
MRFFYCNRAAILYYAGVSTETVVPTPALTVALLKRFNTSRVTRRFRADVTAARVEAVRVRAEVDALLAPVFASFEFAAGEPRTDDGELIQSEDRLWLTDMDCSDWDRKRHETLTAAGYDTTGERCPALVAESNERDAVVALLQHATTVLGIDFVLIWRSGTREVAAETVELMMGNLRR